jgi:predicted DNA binding CopG/RHH family protein
MFYRHLARQPGCVPARTNSDLSTLDFTRFREINWEARPKSARLTMRLPEGLMTALKARAKREGIPYPRLVREAIERELSRP